MQKRTKIHLYSLFLALIAFFSVALSPFNSVSALDYTTQDDGSIVIENAPDSQSESSPETNPESTSKNTSENVQDDSEEKITICTDESDAIGWLVCPGTGVIAKAIDGIYSVINDFLVIEPLTAESTSPIRIIWDYVRGITNIVFVIFLLIVVYSQITGFGISNYGIKRILPKIILVAILVNLSYFICQISIDISNIIGNGLRSFLEGVQNSILVEGVTMNYSVTWTDLTKVFLGTASASAIGITLAGGAKAAFFALLPILAGAIISVLVGLITIALRQAVVMLLAMVSPLAFVCYLLPNTEIWFKKWKNLLVSMIVFYPAFSFLYGASELVGWSIISASDSAFGIIIGLAVQIYPLFASWSLMKMSSTVLGTVSSSLHKLASRPLSAIGRYSAGKQAYHRAKYLGEKPKGISQATLQRINDKAYERTLDTKRYQDLATLRAQARASRAVDEHGHITRRAEEIEASNIESIKYQTAIAKGKNDFEKGLSQLENVKVGSAQMDRLNALDSNIVKAADAYKYELSRGAQIAYRNTAGFNERTQDAINAHMDAIHAGNETYQTHVMTENVRNAALERYDTMKQIYEGHAEDIHFAAADAAQVYAAQTGSIQKKFQAYFDLTAPTQDVIHNLSEITRLKDSTKHIDEIIAGLRTLNMRGDTDLVKDMLDETLVDIETGKKKVRLGTYASQSLANFLMFDVKGADPFLRRFGKYINLETARVYNEADPNKRRRNDELSFDEYVTGEYTDYDENGNPYIAKAKRNAKILLEGTSFKDIERTGYANMVKSIVKACTDANGHVDHAKSEKLQDEIYNATLANLIGDSLTYLSGSEQISSFSQFITGIKKNSEGKYVEDFLDLDTNSEDFRNMSEEDQKALLDHKRQYYKNRTDFFITNHVPSQMGRFKSDIFAGARAMYRNMAEGNLTDAERSELDALLDSTATPFTDKEKAKYNNLSTEKDIKNCLDDRKGAYLDEHGAKKYFKSAVRPKTYEYLQKQYKQGRLGDSKAPISAYLDIDTFSWNNNQTPPKKPEEEEDDAVDDDNTPTPENPDHSNTFIDDAIIAVSDLYKNYNTNSLRHNVAEFFNDVLNTLNSFDLDPEVILNIESLGRSINTITDTSVLYDEITNILNDYS